VNESRPRESMTQTADSIRYDWPEMVKALGLSELKQRHQQVQRLLRENGVTYTFYDEQRHNRPWQLDPVPVLLGNEEWLSIEQGLQQRAILLNCVLKDLYGSQTVLKKNILPAELVFVHQGFLPPCVGSLPAHGGLILHAANLARGSDGRIWVLNDHTQSPSGIGYSLENRSVVARVMSDLFQEYPVRRLSGFFAQLQTVLAAQGLNHAPRIAVLTPGPLNETYFEHAYLASRLGFTLVQGDDLTLRDNKIWLRTIEGLQPVDVILRRVDDEYCDPLELLGSSRLGVTGLLQAVRADTVRLVNPLGSSLLENQGLLAFLPTLCRYFLNEDLKLPSVATWWCGQPEEREFVLKNIHRLVIKSINRSDRITVFGQQLSTQERKQWVERIKARPYLFIGQEVMLLAETPTLVKGQIEVRHSVLRCFTLINETLPHVMPGGLTRVSLALDEFNVANQSGAVSKDTWVLADETTPQSPAVFSLDAGIDNATTEPLSSRAADNFFWVGRYAERILAIGRLLNVILNRRLLLQNKYNQDHKQSLDTLLATLTHLTTTYPGFVNRMPNAQDQEKEILRLCQDLRCSGTLAGSIQAFFQSAHHIRDLWSQETWRSIDAILFDWEQNIASAQVCDSALQQSLAKLSGQIATFSGLLAESMPHESGGLLLKIGRRLEHALSVIVMLRSTLISEDSTPIMQSLLESLLEISDSFNRYQRRYRTVAKFPGVVELLLLDESYPYSVLFQVAHLKRLIACLPGQHTPNRAYQEQDFILKAYTELRLFNLNAIAHDPHNPALSQLFDEITLLLQQASDCMSSRYFNHWVESHELTSLDTKTEDL
jgi:uncharacterized circularly permuted ATP-grasp superfamily protein/uncharacterized alpha-E superfamily protein